MPISSETLGYDDARRMLAAAEARTAETGVPYCIAVVDAAGELLAFVRQDGARRACIELSIGKAATACLFNAPTADLNTLAAPGGPMYGIAQVDGGKVVLLGGGVPVLSGGRLIGAIGASAGSAAQDVAVAQAGVSALTGVDAPATAR